MAFTAQGVAMLSSVLRSKRAVKVNIEIMRAFVKLRQLLASNAELSRRLDELESKYDKHFRIVFDAIRQLMAPPVGDRKAIGVRARKRVVFGPGRGKIFESYSLTSVALATKMGRARPRSLPGLS
jgi:hypothetical protein